MKRWQERGVVEDSEDEELSLDANSPSPERPRKRRKYSQDADAVEDATEPAPEESQFVLRAEKDDEDGWTQPKVAKTYGRNARIANSTSRLSTPEPQANSLSCTEDIPGQLLLGHVLSQVYQVATPTSPVPLPTQNKAQDVASVVADSEESTTTEVPALDDLFSSQRSSTPSSESLGLPSASNLVNADHSRAAELDQDILSSPLSERSVSPPTHWTSPQRANASKEPPLARAASEEDQDDDPLGDQGLDYEAPTATARRTFRNRKPIQLQPYQLERLAYLQKCKARGIQAVVEEERELAARRAQVEEQTSSSQSQEDPEYSIPNSGKAKSPKKLKAEIAFNYFTHIGNDSSEDEEPYGRLPKRRRIMTGLDSTALIDSAAVDRLSATGLQDDDFDVPLSPPSTDGDASTSARGPLHRSIATASGFKIPARLTPAPLPTPQISSDVRGYNDDSSVSSDSPPRRLGSSTAKGRRQMSISVSSSEEEVEAQGQSDVETQRILKERKRIKGVLPASWLKIDFNAQRAKQPPALSHQQRFDTTSPPRSERQKGVAQRIVSDRWHDDRSAAFPTFSGDDSDSALSTQHIGHSRNPTPRRLQPDHLAVAPSTVIDDDEDMENDFVDPMLAGGTLRTTKSRRRRTQQPRITDSFHRTLNPRHDFSEEKSSRVYSTARKKTGIRRTKKGALSRGCRGPPPVHLSIADAPLSPSHDGAALPQFIRLALRRTRQDPMRGRHSPTSKVVRLATATDTEEASSTLRAWRAGTIAPRPSPKTTNQAASTLLPDEEEFSRPERTPLANLSPNKKQMSFPAPAVKSREALRVQPSTPRGPQLHPTRLPATSGGQTEGAAATSAANIAAPSGGHRRLASKPAPPIRLRNAQLESLQMDFDHRHRDAVFERRIQCLTENVALPQRSIRGPPVQLERYFRAATELEGEPLGQTSVQDSTSKAVERQPGPHLDIPYRSRKRQAHRVDIWCTEYQQANEFVPGKEVHPAVLVESTGPVLQGLGGFATRYPIDFDVTPLDTGAQFHPSTFIGSGQFHDALQTSKRDFEQMVDPIRVQLNTTYVEWATWTEDVAANLTMIPVIITEHLQADHSSAGVGSDHTEQQHVAECYIDNLLRSTIRYFSTHLNFADRIDRLACVESLRRLIESLSDLITEKTQSEGSWKTLVASIAQYQLVLVTQAVQLCGHAMVPPAISGQINQLFDRSAVALTKLALVGCSDSIRTAYSRRRQMSAFHTVAQTEDIALSSLVILNHTLQANHTTRPSFWHVLGASMATDASKICTVTEFEDLWGSIFTILPTLEIDASGNAEIGSRLDVTQDGSLFVKTLVGRVLELYGPSSQLPGYPINDYIRTTFSRCYCLATAWGWRRCEPLLNTIYDFFSGRNFALLHNEASYGSPKFLEGIETVASPEVLPEDRSFHIFLKLLLAGLRGMHKYSVYEDRKIQGIAYRLLPNHGRTFRRDTEVQQRDLDALRNHYDLLCTLYCAAPPGWRIALDSVRNLIDHAVSHREACRLSVRAWANITSFQTSTSESLELIIALSDWFSDMFQTALTQYRLAKSEAERDYRRALKEAEQAGANMPPDILESTIASNQLLIAKTIVDALAGLKRAIISCSSLTAAEALLENSNFWAVFDLFDPSQSRLVNAVSEALRVVNAFLDLEARPYSHVPSNQPVPDEDSQDFGDFSALDELVEDEPHVETTSKISIGSVLSPVWHFLSNIFGADRPADDGLLRAVVDTWVCLAKANISQSSKSWGNYVDEYSTESWYQVRDTAQKRKFTAYFLSRVLQESRTPEDIQNEAVTYWVLSLVEREATIRFQNILTSSLLNHCPGEPLLQNLPFSKDSRTREYQITLEELRQRRLALISSVLCNMREHYEEVAREQPIRKLEVKNQYIALLRQLMQAMKKHYQELQTGRNDEVADFDVQGAYVEFVQQVVTFLQQYVASICPVDHFFTDSTAFPLPATDPTYVVGKLRAYVPNLQHSKSRKALATFVQSVSERAAVDGQQPYLADQMCTAMKGTLEQGSPISPSLRHILLSTVFPAYIENALWNPCTWIVVLPMLQASEMVLPSLLYNMDMHDERSVQSVLEITTAMLHSISYQYENALANADHLRSPHALKTLAASMYVCSSCLTLVQYLERTRRGGGELSRRVKNIHEQILAIRAHLAGIEDMTLRYVPVTEEPYSPRWPDAKAVTDKQIHDSFTTSWHIMEGRYFVRRGNASKQISVDLGDVTTERDHLLQAIDEFERRYSSVYDFRSRRRQAAREDDMFVGNVMI